MAEQDLSVITNQLSKVTTEESTVKISYAGQANKWNNADDVKDVVQRIKDHNDLQVLCFEGNTMGAEAAKALGDALKNHPELKEALWSDMFTGRSKAEIPPALEALCGGVMMSAAHLTVLDLSDNAFGPNGMKGLDSFLRSSCCWNMTELKLNNNGLGPQGGTMLASCLTECYTKGKEAGAPLQLRVFVSGRGRLENEGATEMSKVFKLMGTLVEVSMPQNGIFFEGITALAEGLSHNPNLRFLNLSDNTFTVKGAKAMAAVLPKLQKLQTLNFGDCLLKTEGAKFVAESIKADHKELKHLNLSFNEVTLPGGVKVIKSVKNKDKLESLDLNGNQFGDDGIEELLELAENYNKKDIVVKMDEDEGLDSDQEDENDESEENDEDEEKSQSADATPISDQPVSAAEFLKHPSRAKLRQVGGQRGNLFLEELGDNVHDVDQSVAMVMKVSSVVTDGDKETKQYACEVAVLELNHWLDEQTLNEEVYRHQFNRERCLVYRGSNYDASKDAVLERVVQMGEENLGSLMSNTLLVHLGILKSEDKSFAPLTDPNGPLLVLEHVFRQNYFPSSAKNILQCFLSQPDRLPGSQKVLPQVLQALFS